jgi:hypothetical protein
VFIAMFVFYLFFSKAASSIEDETCKKKVKQFTTRVIFLVGIWTALLIYIHKSPSVVATTTTTMKTGFPTY